MGWEECAKSSGGACGDERRVRDAKRGGTTCFKTAQGKEELKLRHCGISNNFQWVKHPAAQLCPFVVGDVADLHHVVGSSHSVGVRGTGLYRMS